MTIWFDNNLKNPHFKNFLYTDYTPCDKLIANVYYDNDGYIVESGELKFTAVNILEVYDCINDISKAYSIYGKCWHLYNKIRKHLDEEDYMKYSIYVSNYNGKGEWIIKLLK